MFSITMYDSETRVYLDPPLKNLREIQLLDCNLKLKKLINFKDQQALFNDKNQVIIKIQPGTYSLCNIQSIFLNDPDVGKDNNN